MHEIRVHNTMSGKVEPLRAAKIRRNRRCTPAAPLSTISRTSAISARLSSRMSLRRFLKCEASAQSRHEPDRRGRPHYRECRRGGRQPFANTRRIHSGFLADCRALSIETPEHWIRATEHIDEMVALIQRLHERYYTYHQRRLDLLPHREIQGLRQALQDRPDAAFRPARAWTTTVTTRKTRATSPCGKRPSPASISGRRRLARGVPAGTSSAPRWP